jgi:hypothetical protein
MTRLSGSFKVTLLGLKMLPARPPHTYMVVAREMYQGVIALASLSRPLDRPLAMLASHSLECLLKAYLTRNNYASPLATGHDLNGLWEHAHADGLMPDSNAPPQWISGLSLIHARPYALRYLSHVDPTTGERCWVHGLSIPPIGAITDGLAAMLDVVEPQLRVIP